MNESNSSGRFTLNGFALFFAALLCASLTAASAYATDYGDLSVKVETVHLGLSESGSVEARAIIVNRSRTKSHRVTIEISSAGLYGQAEARRTVDVGPSSTMTIPLIAPGSGYRAVADVLIDGSRQNEVVDVDFSRTNAWVSRSVN